MLGAAERVCDTMLQKRLHIRNMTESPIQTRFHTNLCV